MTTLLERRRIEAEFAKAVFDEMLPVMGEDRALELLGAVARKLAHAMGRQLAAQDGATDLASFAANLALWSEGGAQEIEPCEATDTSLAFDVTRCRYAEMYREIGAEKLGAALSCNRDGALCEGYDSRITMQRDDTIMAGKARCNFRFTLAPGPAGPPEKA